MRVSDDTAGEERQRAIALVMYKVIATGMPSRRVSESTAHTIGRPPIQV